MYNIPLTKIAVCAAGGSMAALITTLIGDWGESLKILLILMVADYVTGIIVAAVYKQSNKSQNGALSSTAGLKGICKKILMLILIVVATQIDNLTGVNYVRLMTIFALCLNEIISLIENIGIFLPIPKVITKAIDILKNRAGNEEIETKKEDISDYASEEIETKKEDISDDTSEDN